eukprot:TCONS_00024354-protein
MAEKSSAGKAQNEEEKKINFSVLKKHDPNISKIIDTAKSVAHYQFNSSSNVWEKTEVEGSLFLYSRDISPIVIIFIMNRLSKENTRLPLTADMEIKVQQPFLLCKLKTNEIIGIWFYDPDECQRFGDLLIKLSMLCKDETKLKIALMMETQRQEELKKKEAQHKSGIMGMFNKAQEDFNAKNRKSASPGNRNKSNNAQNKRANQQQQNQQQQQGKNKNDANKPQTDKKKTQHQQNSKPKTPTIEQQRQKQQKVFQESHQKELDLLSILHGGKKQDTSSTKPLPNRSRTTSTSTARQESSSGFDMNQFASQAGDLAISTGIPNNKPIPKVFDCAELESKLIRGESSDMREVHSSPSLRTLSQIENTRPGALNLNVTPKGPQVMKHAHSVPAHAHTSLVSPNIMSNAGIARSGGVFGKDVNNQQKIALAANFGTGPPSGNRIAKKLFDDGSSEEDKPKTSMNSMLASSLLSPAAFTQPTTTTAVKADLHQPPQPQIDSTNNVILNREQFQQAFIHMLQTNDDFVTTLHESYMNQLNNT